jgi:hypothetical protein
VQGGSRGPIPNKDDDVVQKPGLIVHKKKRGGNFLRTGFLQFFVGPRPFFLVRCDIHPILPGQMRFLELCTRKILKFVNQ